MSVNCPYSGYCVNEPLGFPCKNCEHNEDVPGGTDNYLEEKNDDDD